MVSNIPLNYGNYGYLNTASNDDFMYKAYSTSELPAANVNGQSNINFQGAAQASPKRGLGMGAVILSGRAGAGAGYLLDSNPLKNSKQFKDSFVKAMNTTADKANKYVRYFNQETKTFTEAAPSLFNKALKSFKWRQAGKWGAIVAGSLIGLDWLFSKFRK